LELACGSGEVLVELQNSMQQLFTELIASKASDFMLSMVKKLDQRQGDEKEIFRSWYCKGLSNEKLC